MTTTTSQTKATHKTRGLFSYLRSLIDRLQNNGKFRTAETYQTTLNSFRRFRNGEEIGLDDIDTRTMEAYQCWLQSHRLTPNTISFYMRILRATYNRAVEENLITDLRPFRRVYTGIDKTPKRALPLSVIKRIKDLDLSSWPELDFARDMFMMSFMLRGMSFIDMAYLKHTDLCNGYLTYRRSKTGQRLQIKWTDEMADVMAKYPENPTPYLLPIIRSTEINPRYAYKNVGYNINHNLKRIARILDLPHSHDTLCSPPQLGFGRTIERHPAITDQRRTRP